MQLKLSNGTISDYKSCLPPHGWRNNEVNHCEESNKNYGRAAMFTLTRWMNIDIG